MAFGCFLPTTSSRFVSETLKSQDLERSEEREPGTEWDRNSHYRMQRKQELNRPIRMR